MSMTELREQIAVNSRRIRRKAILEKVEVLTALLAKADSKKEFRSLTDIDWDRIAIIGDIMRINDKRTLGVLKGVIQASERKK